MSDIPLIPLIEPDHSASAVPDYDLVDSVRASTPAQMKALGDPIRQSILTLVMDRAATTTELARALQRPKGTVDHHLKVLAGAGLVRVVRTRKVRAMTERYWGRTARTIFFDAEDHELSTTSGFIRKALNESDRVGPWSGPASGPGTADDRAKPGFTTLRHARVPADKVREFSARLDALSAEFMATARGGDTVYAMLIAVYPTDRPILAEPETAPEPATR